MIPMTIDELKGFLKKNNFDVQFQPETNQLYIVFKISGFEFPLFIRIMDDATLVQLLIFMPVGCTPGAEPHLARLLHLINKELDIPGFGVDEEAGVIFYRVVLPTVQQKLDEAILTAYLNSFQQVAETFFPAIATVAQGKSTFDEILKKAKESQQQ